MTPWGVDCICTGTTSNVSRRLDSSVVSIGDKNVSSHYFSQQHSSNIFCYSALACLACRPTSLLFVWGIFSSSFCVSCFQINRTKPNCWSKMDSHVPRCSLESAWSFPQSVFVWLQIPATLLDTGGEREWARDKGKEREVDIGREGTRGKIGNKKKAVEKENKAWAWEVSNKKSEQEKGEK